MSTPPLLWQYLEGWARHSPEKEAMTFRGERVTYGEFWRRARRLAKLFLELGVERGDRVAMLSPARPEFFYIYLATGMAGGIWYGLNPRYTLSELRALVQDARPRVLVAVREHLGRDFKPDLVALLEESPFVERILVLGEPWAGPKGKVHDFRKEMAEERPRLDRALEARLAEGRPEDSALIVYTSGTTGQPKGALLTHRNISSNIEVQVKRFFMGPEGTNLVHFPINHVACSTEIAVGSLVSGGRLVFLDKFDPREALETIEREKVTFLGQVPAMVLLEFQLPDFERFDLSGVETYVWGGSPAPRSMIERLAATGKRLVTGYGMTETAGFVTYTSPQDSLDDQARTVGKADPAYEVKLVGADRREVRTGEVGEIAVRGSSVMKGYWRRPEATAEALDAAGWLYTGDLATIDGRGFITLAGRAKEMFKSGGYNIYPREIEAVLEAHESVAMAVVVPVPHEIYQEVGKAVIIPKPGQQVRPEELESLCRRHLANFKVPKSFEVRAALPLLPNGKVDRRALIEEAKPC